MLDFAPAWGQDAETETGPEAANLAAWRCKSGRGTAIGEGDSGRRGGGADFPESGRPEIRDGLTTQIGLPKIRSY